MFAVASTDSHTLIDMMGPIFNVWVILVWLHMPSNKIDQYCLQALNLHRLPFLPKRHTKFEWRGGGSPIAASTSAATTSSPRKYRHLDVQEEYSRERSGVYNHFLPYQWLDQITQKLRPQDVNEGNIGEFDKSLISSSKKISNIAEQSIPQNFNETSIPIPVLESLLRKKQHLHIVSNVNALRGKILDEGLSLHEVKIECPYASANATVADVLQHEVIQIMVSRYHSQSRPGQRYSNDTAYLALAIEGGGVRGAVCSGMAAAIATLGLTDSFDTIIGSSAGSVIGAYMVRFVEI